MQKSIHRPDVAVHSDADNEVPRMTSDIFYESAGQFVGRIQDSLTLPDRPVRDRWFRPTYTPAGDGLEIVNGPNLFNRPLFAPGCRTLVTAGDRPALILWTSAHYPKPNHWYFGKPDWLGHLFVGLSDGGKSRWFHEFAECRAHYHPGWVEYRLCDPAFPGTEVRLEILPHPFGAVWVNVELARAPRAGSAPAVVWTHGCLGSGAWWNDCYDISTSLPFTWDEPHLAANDRVEFDRNLAILRDASDLANWVAVASDPGPDELFSTDAGKRLDLAPDDLRAHPAAGAPAAAGRVPLQAGTEGLPACRLLLNWGRNDDPVAAMVALLPTGGARTAEAREHFRRRTERIAIRTPDPALDTAFRFAVVAADGMWHPPGINHSPFSWPGLTPIFRTFYGLTACGDHDRVASALRLHGRVNEKGQLLNLVSAVGEEPHCSPYESYGSTVDMLWHHYLWSGDRRMLEAWLPLVDRMLAYEERERKAASGLFVDNLGFWCSDSFHYAEGSAVGTIFVWRMYTVRGWMAEALGQDPAPFRKRADEIRALLLRLLWNEEGGFLCDSIDDDGQVKPTTIAPTVYHAIEYGLVTGADARRMFDWMVTHLLSPAGLIRVNDWFPISWSQHLYSPNETGNAAVAAFLLRRDAEGYAMLRGIARGTIERTLAPGGIMCTADSTGVQTMGADFGDGVSLFLRANIEGLFGVRMDRPRQWLRLEPNLPPEWDRAELVLPDLGRLTVTREPRGGGVRHTYELALASPLRISASLPAGGPVREVAVNGKAVTNAVCAADFVELDIPAATECRISFETAAAPSIASVPAPAAPAREVARTMPAAPARFEPIRLAGAAAPIPFEKAHALFPGEQTWYLKKDWNWRCEVDPRFGAAAVEFAATPAMIPFRFDRGNILGFQKQTKDSSLSNCFTSNRFNLDVTVPETLVIPIGQPAREVYVLASGLCTPMTCHLPQVEIGMEYEDGRTFRRRLTAPGEFDFITQHTAIHSSVAIGWFVSDQSATKPLLLRQGSRPAAGVDGRPNLAELARDPLHNIHRRLHADVIRLTGADGVLQRLSFKPLQRESGMLVYGVTLATEPPAR